MNAVYLSPWIYTTKRCNLNCNYCYLPECRKSSDAKYDMPEEVYNAIINQFKGYDNINYRISGGEPLLVFDNWKGFVERAYGSFSLITNLTILTDEIGYFLRKHKFSFGISLDGMEYSKPYLKTGHSSAKAVIKNIETLKSEGVHDIHISTVFKENNLNEYIEIAKFVSKYDLSWGIYLDHYFDKAGNSDKIVSDVISVFGLLGKLKYNMAMFKFNNMSIVKSYDGCTAGKHLCAIDIDGSVYPCQTATEMRKCGNVSEFVDWENLCGDVEDYKCLSIPKEKCSKCAIREYCRGGCKLHSADMSDDLCNLNVSIMSNLIENCRRV